MNNEISLEWRKMTSEEMDQFAPDGTNAFCETKALMEEHYGNVRIAIDEHTIYLEFQLPQYQSDDPDALLAIRDHNMDLEEAKNWVEENLPNMVWRNQLAAAGFNTEVI